MNKERFDDGSPDFVLGAMRHAGRHWHEARRRHGFGPHGFGPAMGRDFWRFLGGPGWHGRMRRGDVRAAILALLKEGPRNGYGIIQEIERRSGGFWKPSAGAVYPALQQLEDEGLIEQRDRDGRREYGLTEAGTGYVAEHEGESQAPWEAVSGETDEGVVGLMSLVRQVGMASVQVGQAGTPAQIEEARRLLRDMRRKLYGILAADEEAASAEV